MTPKTMLLINVTPVQWFPTNAPRNTIATPKTGCIEKHPNYVENNYVISIIFLRPFTYVNIDIRTYVRVRVRIIT